MLFCFILQRPSCSTLFPYTTLFRSFGPVRTVARISPLQPGRILGHGGRLCRVLPHSDERREAAGRSARMGDHPRIPLRPGGLAIRARPRRAAQDSAGRNDLLAMINFWRSIAGLIEMADAQVPDR